MKQSPLVLVALAVLASSLVFPSVAAARVRDDRPNLIGGEVGGRGLLFTLNYERFLSNEFGLGAGIMAIKTGDGGITMLPIYASFVPGDTHSPYLSIGGTMLAGGGDVQDWESTWVFSLSAGYQYQSSGGFFVRPFFTYLRPSEEGSGDDYLIWPGLTVGGSF